MTEPDHIVNVDACVLSTAVIETEKWLQDELLAERAAINGLVEARHRDLLAKLAARLQPHLVHLQSKEPDEARDEPVLEQAAGEPAFEQDLKTAMADLSPASSKAKATEPEHPLVAIPVSSPATRNQWPPAATRSSTTSFGQPEQRGLAARLEAFVTSGGFEVFFGFLIVANAMIMAVQRQYEGHCTAYLLGYKGTSLPEETWPHAPDVFSYLEWVFGCTFTLEVLIKMFALRKKFFTDTLWNVFDLAVVSIWVADRITLSSLSLDPTLLRMARIVRLARLLRVMRWLQILDPLILMVKAIKASVSVLFWSLLLMMLFISVVAMAVSAVLEPFVRDPEAAPFDVRVEVFQGWGTYTRAMETMFEITLTNFGPATRLLMNEVHEAWAWMVLAYKLTVGFAVVQVIISVFIQQTFKIASRDEEVMIKEKAAAARSYAKNLNSLFEYLDESGDGMISKEEFAAVMHDKRVKTWFAALEVEANEVSEIFDLLDDGDGQITQEEFLHGVKSLKGGAKGTDMLMVLRDQRKHERIITSISEKIDLMSHKLFHSEPALPAAQIADELCEI